MYSDDNFNNVIIILFFLIDEYNPERIIKVSEWLNSGSLYIDWSLNFNRLTALMVFLVNFVSTIVHVYSVGYMNNDDRRSIFLSYLGLFTFFMLMLVTSSNLIQLFLGWEGVGLTSIF